MYRNVLWGHWEDIRRASRGQRARQAGRVVVSCGRCRRSAANDKECSSPINHGLIIVNIMPRIKWLMSIYSRSGNVSSSEVHRLPSCELRVEWTGFIRRPTWLFMSASPDCHDVRSATASAWHRAWLGYCVVWLRKLAKPVNMQCFLLVRQLWEGCGWEKCPNLLRKASWVLGQEAWFKTGMGLLTRYLWRLESWWLSRFEHTWYGGLMLG